MLIFRNDISAIGQWWREIDKFVLAIIVLFFVLSFVLGLAASSFLANKNDVSSFILLPRQLLYISLSLGIICIFSLIPLTWIRYAMFTLLPIVFIMLILVFAVGDTIKGSKRWLNIGFVTLQPSEFFKPVFIFCMAYLLAHAKIYQSFFSYVILCGIIVLYSVLVILQPDIGQVVVILGVSLAMIFVSGLAVSWLSFMVACLGLCVYYIYVQFPHVNYRVNLFIEQFSFFEVNYISQTRPEQTDIALQAILNGGWLGRGAGEGIYKYYLPDSYSDFILTIAIEEFGIIFSLCIVTLFIVFATRIFYYTYEAKDLFIKFYLGGFLLLFCGQTLIHMAVNLVIVPTKGMTLPIVSYGGSSMLALSIMLGIVLRITRRKKYIKYDPVAFTHLQSVANMGIEK